MFDSILKMNLTGEEKELFYLTEYVGVKFHSPSWIRSLFGSNLLEMFKSTKPKTFSLHQSKQKSKETEEIMEKGAEFDEPFQKAEMFDPLEIEETTTIDAGRQKPEVKKQLELDLTPLGYQTSISYILDCMGKEITFSIVGLPENYYDCYNSFIYQSCEICQKPQRKKDLVVCLLCAKQMCCNICPGKEPKSENSRKLYSSSGQPVQAHPGVPRRVGGLLRHLQRDVHHLLRSPVAHHVSGIHQPHGRVDL